MMENCINTVCGPVPSDAVDMIQPHEHLMFAAFGDRVPYLEKELVDFKQAGGDVIVDMSTPMISKPEDRVQRLKTLREVSQKTGVHICYGTGFYKEPRLPEFIESSTVDDLKKTMIEELLSGPGGCGICAAVIGEVGSSNYEMFDTEKKVLRAAGRASVETGAAITTHTGRGTMYKEQLQCFEEEGADLSRVAIGHQDVFPRLNERWDAYEYILSKGAIVQFDCAGKEGFFEIERDVDYGQKFPYDNERAQVIAEFVKRGYISQLLVSCDVDSRILYKNWGGRGYSHLLTSFVPMLREAGLSETQIHQLIYDNPRRFLTIEK